MPCPFYTESGAETCRARHVPAGLLGTLVHAFHRLAAFNPDDAAAENDQDYDYGGGDGGDLGDGEGDMDVDLLEVKLYRRS